MSSDYDLVLNAARFAAQKHAGVTRKYSREPYILHPMRVAGRVMLHEIATPDTIAAAWLHDVVEDTPVQPSEIADLFGQQTAKYVDELTNISDKLSQEAVQRGEGALNRQQRKLLDNQRLATVCRESQIIKCCDSLDNLLETHRATHREDRRWAILYAKEAIDRLEYIGAADPVLNGEVRLAAEWLIRCMSEQ